jgi:hypothetical protein
MGTMLPLCLIENGIYILLGETEMSHSISNKNRKKRSTAKYRACMSKNAYLTANDAAHVAGDRALKGTDKLTIYKCTFCECYHIAKWRKQSMTKK